MINLPQTYRYLNYEPGPRMLREALKLYGVEEVLGPGDNPLILAWAKEIGSPGYTHDAIAWCGLGEGLCAKRAGWEYQPKGNALYALNWASWGTSQKVAMLGDTLVKKRVGGGHVCQYVGEDRTAYHVIGFNQGDKVSFERIPKTQIVAIRRAPWKKAQPPNVRVIQLNDSGPVVAMREN